MGLLIHANHFMYIPYLLLSVAASAVMLLSACGKGHEGHDHDHEGDAHSEATEEGHHHAPDEIEFSTEQARAAGVEVTTLQPTDFSEVIEVSGQVLPASGAEATVSATMAGIVRFAGGALTEGQAVGNGQALFIVNGKPMADGNPAAVAQSEAKAARLALDRAEKLAAEKIISQRELEEARQRYEAASATAQSLGSATQSRAISAPIGGYLKTLLVRPGDYVSAGQALATVTQSKRVQLRADVPERYFGMLPRISTANFRMAYDESDHVYSLSQLGGRLVSKGRASSTGESFVPVIFEFNNQGSIVSGSFAQVYLQGNVRSGVLAIPTEAITESQGVYFVYVQQSADSYRRVEVTLGSSDGLRTEILSGLRSGDKVVTRGATLVRLAANATAVPESHSH